MVLVSMGAERKAEKSLASKLREIGPSRAVSSVGCAAWGAGASEGTKRDREDTIDLRRRYLIRWTDYADPVSAKNGKFRYLVIEVGR